MPPVLARQGHLCRWAPPAGLPISVNGTTHSTRAQVLLALPSSRSQVALATTSLSAPGQPSAASPACDLAHPVCAHTGTRVFLAELKWVHLTLPGSSPRIWEEPHRAQGPTCPGPGGCRPFSPQLLSPKPHAHPPHRVQPPAWPLCSVLPAPAPRLLARSSPRRRPA